MKSIVVSLTLLIFLIVFNAGAGADAASASLLQAKKDAEAKGYIFFATHDEIAAAAKKEGKLRVSSGLEPTTLKRLIEAFVQKYPFMSDTRAEEIAGREAYQRFILELKAGQAKEWDITYVPIDFAEEYMPYLMRHDIFNMTKQGVLKIDPRMVHPSERNIVGVTSTITVVAYNRKLVSEDKVPAKWEDFLKPELKGKKFILDTRPTEVAALVPAWGLDKTLDFARKLAAQEPVWGSSGTRSNTSVAAGEYPISFGASFNVIKRVTAKDTAGSLTYKVSEPIPARNLNHASGITNTAAHPAAALLWLEFLASSEGQQIIDKYEPFAASLFTSGSVLEQMTRGKALSVVDWEHFTKFQGYTEAIVAAYGFPNTKKAR